MLTAAWSPLFNHPLPEHHRFPMRKYDDLPEILIREGILSPGGLVVPDHTEKEILTRIHSPDYLVKLKEKKLSRAEERRTGFPYSSTLLERENAVTNGTLKAAGNALKFGIAFNIAGGTHHAYPDHGEGFCLFNDIAVSAAFLKSNHHAKNILVVDLDVHQGNGTAYIFRNDPSVFTFSMHGKNNYPLHKETSDLDISLPDGTGDKEYLSLLERNLEKIADEFQPEFVFYQAGVDILETDALGKLKISMNGCRKRDEIVLKTCRDRKTPVAVTMGGGYSPEISTILSAHRNTFLTASELYF